MKNACVLLVVASILTACGHTETSDKNSETRSDSVATTQAKPKNCKSVIEADKLGKADEYQESAKPIKVMLTLEQDSSTTQTDNGCYFNHSVTVLTTRKTGSRIFKRTLLKDDLLYFSKNDGLIEQSLLQKVAYKPTFNGQKYITLTMQLIDPTNKETTNYTVFMNYFGEIVKVK